MAGTPPVAGLHPQFGADASSEVTVSWHMLRQVRNPRVVLGRPDGKFEQTVDAEPTSYTDGKSHRVVYGHHAKLGPLQPDSACMYGAELGNGPIGYQAYQTHFSVPEATGQTGVTRGLWYAFTAGSVRVISIANDDLTYQDGGNSPSNQLFFNPPQCRVIVSVGSADPARNVAHAYGFAAFMVDPGSQPGGFTAMTVVYYDVVGPGAYWRHSRPLRCGGRGAINAGRRERVRDRNGIPVAGFDKAD